MRYVEPPKVAVMNTRLINITYLERSYRWEYFNSQFESGTLIFLNKLSVPVVIKEVSSMTSATR